MTVTAETNKATYSGDGATASFSTAFTFSSNAQVTVTLVASDGTETEWTEGSEYTLTGAGTGAAGTVTVDTSPTDYTPASGETLVIQLKPDYLQSTPLPRGGTVSPKLVLEPMYDTLLRQILRLKDDVDRSVKAPISETTPGAALPLAASRAGKVFAFDANGYPTVSTEDLSDIEGAATSAAAAATSAAAASASASAASADADDAQSFATQAQAAAYGWTSITNITTGTTDLETTDTRKYYKLNASGGAITINLPAIGSDEGMTFRFEVVNADNTITIARDGADYINGVNGDYTLSNVGTIIDFISDDATPDNWLASFASNIQADGTTISQSGTTFSVATGGVDTTQLADDAVTLAKIAAGTDGELITWDASGDPTTVSVGTSGQVLTSNGAGAAPTFQNAAAAGITLGTEQATTSGTAFDFTSIPSGTKRITVTLENVSTDAADNLLIQIGDSGGVETTGYDSASGFGNTSVSSSTSGFIVKAGGGTAMVTGLVILTLSDSANNTWVSSHAADEGAGNIIVGGGAKSLSAELDRVRLTRTGSANFDAGAVNIIYE